MREQDVPQQHSDILQGQRKVVYAVNAQGEYERVPSSGWEAEELVTQEANDWFDSQALAAKIEYQQQRFSSLKYHMFKQRMDIPTLSQATGIWQWRVKRHLQYQGFERLKPSTKQRYADAMAMDIAQLEQII